jgi:HAMP domain-containing protein
MSPEPRGIVSLRPRLDTLVERARELETEGLPFPTDAILESFQKAAKAGDVEAATGVVKRGEALLTRAGADWTWVRELLRRADELRAIAGAIGVDLAILDSRVGNPRLRLMGEPLSSGSLEKAAASASLALAVLNDAVPKFCVQEAQALGVSIRRARDRGEDVGESTRSFARLLQALQDQNLATAAQRLVETRRTVARIPRAPALPPLSAREEEEILLEARNLARRLQRIKGKARDASSAARLMAQVRAAISEDRRYGTPEEEIEQLWAEVDRLTQEKKKVAVGASPTRTAAGRRGGGEPAEPEGEAPAEDEEPGEHERTVRMSYYSPYVPPEERPEDEEGEPGSTSPTGRGRNRPRPRP